jgi:hypothetical protein
LVGELEISNSLIFFFNPCRAFSFFSIAKFLLTKKIRTMKIFLFLILLLLSCKSVPDSKPIENQEDKALIKKWIVTPDSGLNLRDAPSRKAKSIRLLLRGTMVSHKQLSENEKLDTIEDQNGKERILPWCRI